MIQSLILSQITYGICIWGTAISTQIGRVQKLQNIAAKAALGGAAKHDHVTPYLKELGWLKVKQKYYFELGVVLYNVINKRIPHWLLTLPRVSDVNERVVNTRQQQQLYVPKCNTCLGKKSPTVAGPSLWNSLPTDVGDANSLSSFKRCLKNIPTTSSIFRCSVHLLFINCILLIIFTHLVLVLLSFTCTFILYM